MFPRSSRDPEEGELEATATRPESAPEETSPIFEIRALGVRGGVRSRRDKVVVCDFRRVVAAWMAAMGLGMSCAALVAGVEVAVVVEFGLEVEGASEDWKCERRVCVVCVRDMRVWRSFGGAILASVGFGVQRQVCVSHRTEEEARCATATTKCVLHKKCQWFGGVCESKTLSIADSRLLGHQRASESCSIRHINQAAFKK